MTNLDRNGPASSWLWSGGPVQARAFDLDGRQTSYPYTGAGTVNGLRCWVPCDHVPVRSWPLFRARQLMRDVIESFKQDQAL